MWPWSCGVSGMTLVGVVACPRDRRVVAGVGVGEGGGVVDGGGCRSGGGVGVHVGVCCHRCDGGGIAGDHSEQDLR